MSLSTPEERLRAALDLADLGVEMMRTRLRREHPEWDESRLQDEMRRWLLHRPGAPIGDHPGPRSTRVIDPRST